MKRILCPQEESVSNAARTGRWDDSIRAHVRQCAYCLEIAGIAEWMGRVAATDTAESVLPDPGQILLSARVAAMQTERERALRPLAIVELIVKIVLILVLAAGILWAWFGFRSLAADFLAARLHLPQAAWISAAALATCLLVLLFTRLAQPILMEE